MMRQHINTHMKVHRKVPEVMQVLQMEKPDFTKLRKLGDHTHNQTVMKEGVGELILSRRPVDLDEVDVAHYGPCTNCKKCYSRILGLCRRRTTAALFVYTVYNRQCLLARPRSDLWTLDMLQGH